MVPRKAKRKKLSNHQEKERKRLLRKLRKARKSKLALQQFATDVLVAIITDGFNTLPSYRYADYRMDVQTVKDRIHAEGLYFAVKVLPGLIQTVLDKLEGRNASFSGFKIRNGAPTFLGRCITNALAGKSEYIRFVYQVSVALKKIQGSYSQSSIEQLWIKYKAEDATLGEIDWFEPKRFELLERARHYARVFFRDFDPYGPDTVPRPGPGATNTKCAHYMRYLPHAVYEQVDRCFPTEDWFYPNPWEVNNHSREFLALPRIKEPCSRYKPVPKTALEMRGICIEENEVQFFQQGLRRALTKHINRHPLYCRRIVLHDQSINGWMAYVGSLYRRFATLDLKSASDLDARELVSWIVQDNQDLHDALMALSTKWVQPPKGVNEPPLRMFKFAPMGSAICFPIMSLMFMFIIRAAISLSDLPYPHLLSTNVFVYGDDIVVPSSTYDIVTEALTSLGFKVNLTKSFVNSSFRESCGVHAYNGVDVTPVFLRKLPSPSQLSSMMSLIETESQFYEKGYFETAAMLRGYGSHTFPKTLGNPLYVDSKSSVVGWKRTSVPDSVCNQMPRTVRWNPDLQRHEVRVRVIANKAPKCSLVHASDAILRWIATSPEPFESRTCLGDVHEEIQVLKYGWKPVSELIL